MSGAWASSLAEAQVGDRLIVATEDRHSTYRTPCAVTVVKVARVLITVEHVAGGRTEQYGKDNGMERRGAHAIGTPDHIYGVREWDLRVREDVIREAARKLRLSTGLPVWAPTDKAWWHGVVEHAAETYGSPIVFPEPITPDQLDRIIKQENSK